MSTKSIYFIRHFEAMHNIEPWNHQLHDPELSPVGQLQAPSTIERVEQIEQIDLVVCSPMTRTLQTYLNIFRGNDTIHHRLSKIPLIIHPDAQEILEKPCDTGRPIVELREKFPILINELNKFETMFAGFEWLNKSDPSNLYHPQRIHERILRLLRWLVERPEKSIVVISHGLLIKEIFRRQGQDVHLSNGAVYKAEYSTDVSLLNNASGIFS